MNAAPVEFWFDFGSPYGYLMAEHIDALAAAHGRHVRWQPMLLFAVLRRLSMPPPLEHAPKHDYLLLDVERSARHLGQPYRHPSRFPLITPLPGRMFHVLAERDPPAAAEFARDALRAAFRDDAALDDADLVAGLAARHDTRSAAQLREAANAELARRALADAIAEAAAHRVFGSPFVRIDGEPFFGVDRLAQIEERLAGRLAPCHRLEAP